jgi:hypothetical protein
MGPDLNAPAPPPEREDLTDRLRSAARVRPPSREDLPLSGAVSVVARRFALARKRAAVWMPV